jgi:RND family efflux transporter MFP subunit
VVPVVTAERRVAAEGRVATYPGGEVIVGTERAGRLVRVAFEEGQAVRRGELVAELDSEEIRAALAEARARLVEGEAELRLAEATLERRRELAEQRVISAHDLDQARRDLDTALARIETARATVARHEAQLAKARIVAPISGTVIARHVDAGETLEAGARVVTLGDLSRLRVEAEADEADAAALELGAPATITADGYPGRSWRGSVEEIADAVTPRRLKPQDPSRPTDTRILALKIAFAEPSPLKLGTTVELRIRPAGR